MMVFIFYLQFSGGIFDKLEEDYIVVRIYIIKIKSDIKILVFRVQQLEVMEVEVKDKFGSVEKEFSDCKFIIQQVGFLWDKFLFV